MSICTDGLDAHLRRARDYREAQGGRWLASPFLLRWLYPELRDDLHYMLMAFARYGRQSISEVEQWPMRKVWRRWDGLMRMLDSEAKQAKKGR